MLMADSFKEIWVVVKDGQFWAGPKVRWTADRALAHDYGSQRRAAAASQRVGGMPRFIRLPSSTTTSSPDEATTKGESVSPRERRERLRRVRAELVELRHRRWTHRQSIASKSYVDNRPAQQIASAVAMFKFVQKDSLWDVGEPPDDASPPATPP
jgi:hypothetical protein